MEIGFFVHIWAKLQSFLDFNYLLVMLRFLRAQNGFLTLSPIGSLQANKSYTLKTSFLVKNQGFSQQKLPQNRQKLPNFNRKTLQFTKKGQILQF